MTVEEVQEVIDKKPNFLWTSMEVNKFMNNGMSATRNNLRTAVKTSIIGCVDYRGSAYFYFSLLSNKFKKLPQYVFLLQPRTFDKKICIKHLNNLYGVLK